MKFNKESYEKELLLNTLKNNSVVEGEEKLRNIRPTREGIALECLDSKGWKKVVVGKENIHKIMEELRA